tara:strand:- start:386 stop:1471 length:1086 start_codon:yes stop_codon:yes gene_type:complete
MALTTIPVELVTFDDGVTITTDDNSNNLTIISTDADASNGPNIKFHRNSGSPADNDYGGYILFNAENDASEDTAFSYIGQQLIDVSDGTEDGRLFIYNMQGGTSVNAIDVLPTETVFNEGSVDRDFRVESDANANSLYLDGATGVIGLGFANTTAANQLHILGTDSVPSVNMTLQADDTANATAGITLMSRNSSNTNVNATLTNVTTALQSSLGITFGSDTAAANALDDYEEGTWSPTFTGSSASGSQSYSYQNGFYIKIGHLVHAFFDMNISSSSGMSGAPQISLPVPSVNANWYAPIVPWEISSNFTDSDQKAVGYVVTNSSIIIPYKYESHNSVVESSGYFNMNVTGRISGQVTYQAA